MGRKKATSDEQAPLPGMPEPTPPEPAADSGSKADKIRGLLDEWSAAGKDVRSNEGLLAELQSRHPGVNFTAGDLAQTKTKWKKARGEGGNGEGRTVRRQTARAGLSDLVQVAKAVKACIDSHGAESVRDVLKLVDDYDVATVKDVLEFLDMLKGD